MDSNPNHKWSHTKSFINPGLNSKNPLKLRVFFWDLIKIRSLKVKSRLKKSLKNHVLEVESSLKESKSSKFFEKCSICEQEKSFIILYFEQIILVFWLCFYYLQIIIVELEIFLQNIYVSEAEVRYIGSIKVFSSTMHLKKPAFLKLNSGFKNSFNFYNFWGK